MAKQPSEKKPASKGKQDYSQFNNRMRHTYRGMSPEQEQDIRELKDIGLQFILKLHRIEGNHREATDLGGEMAELSSEYLRRARLDMESAVMFAVKEVSG